MTACCAFLSSVIDCTVLADIKIVSYSSPTFAEMFGVYLFGREVADNSDVVQDYVISFLSKCCAIRPFVIWLNDVQSIASFVIVDNRCGFVCFIEPYANEIAHYSACRNIFIGSVNL